MNLKKLLSSSSYTVINKHLMKHIGLEETFMLQYLLDLQTNTFKGEFYQQQSRLSEEFNWSLHKVKTTMTSLKDLGLINIIKKGVPARNFFVINESKVIEILSDQSDQTKLTSGQNDQLDNIELTSQLKISSLDSSNEAHIEQNKQEQNNKNKIIIDNIDKKLSNKTWSNIEVKELDTWI